MYGVALLGCGDDDNPTRPGDIGSASNPESVSVGTPVAKSLAAGGTYYMAFKTSAAGDYIPSLTSDQQMLWTMYQDPSAKAKAPEEWEFIGACGAELKFGDLTCTATGLDRATEFILELSNLGSAESTYTLTVTQGMGVGSVNHPVEWVGSIADCTDSFPGQVGTRFSYYKVTDLSRSGANASYIFNNMSADADFFVYSDPDFSTLLTSTTFVNSTYDDVVVPVPEGGVFYVRADGSKTAAGTTFTFACD
jgi:hypothetical protein